MRARYLQGGAESEDKPRLQRGELAPGAGQRGHTGQRVRETQDRQRHRSLGPRTGDNQHIRCLQTMLNAFQGRMTDIKPVVEFGLTDGCCSLAWFQSSTTLAAGMNGKMVR